ncbi:ATP-dependent helicase/nuclease subunit B [Halopenitus malekzadehii]|uniref:ATP-dependent helicase/nuclease subunit B n=1 Tax=Halopenitus malekzadehii TaxID=1267564 RepID=A0A1H6IG14_9EURY|nr:hypothetical protein [Halopenitus malekzadehii]SEH46132.1 ATP-dependent helicase/nuclease subunit B [Halopenitus malekzadehii]
MTSADRLALADPLPGADVPAVELVTTTRRAEARSAMATVAALRGAGVGVRDVAVVARDLDEYEEPLYRAAVQYGATPVFWTQLRVTRTTPFALLEAVCKVLAATDLDAEALCRPLEHGWCPPDISHPASAADSDEIRADSSTAWPLDPRTIRNGLVALPADRRTIDEWAETLSETPSVDDRIRTYVEWMRSRPAPSPDAVGAVFGDVVDAYERAGLPATKARDSPALIETERDARAVVRLEALVRQLPYKYADRIAEGTLTQSWDDVADLARLIATQRPGRREHSNARAVDVLEANDVWLLDVPYVVVVGLVDGEWPRTSESPIPPELQEAVLAGAEGTSTLAPRTAWTDGRDRDQFDDACRAAGRGLVLTRHTETMDGDPRRRSPLLDQLDPTAVDDDALHRLVSPDRRLPEPLREIVEDRGATAEGRREDGGDR